MKQRQQDQSRFRVRLEGLARELGVTQNSAPSFSDIFGGTEQTDTEIDAALKTMASGRYRQTLEALHRLNQGDYGICCGCGQSIDEERLEIIPEAAYCVACQQRREHYAEAEFNETKKGLDLA